MADKYTFLLLGCGHIAQRHIVCIQQVGKLLAVCDIDAEKAKALAGVTDVQSYTDYNRMYKDNHTADVVVICTPNGLHAIHSIDALNAGFHVLCEKPMAIKSVDASLMLAAASSNKKQLFIVKQNRFNPPVKTIKKLLSENRLGKIYSVQLTCIWNRPENYYKNSLWKGTKELDGGTLFTQFSHFIDILYWYFGDIEVVSAIAKNAAHPGIEFEDEGGVLFTTESGITGTIHYSVNSWKNNIEGSLLIVGEKGTVKIGGQYLNTLEYQNIDDYKIEELPSGNPANNYGAYQGSMSNHEAVYENLVATLNGIEPIATGGYEAGKTVSIIRKKYTLKRYSYKYMQQPILKESSIRDIQCGENVVIIQPCNLYECSIGSNSFIGPFTEIQKAVIIGHSCKIQSHSFICEGVTIGNQCFIGHGVLFINDTFTEGKPAGGDKTKWKKTLIGNNVTIGSNATILPVTICDNVVIGAAAVVTKDILQPGIYAGNPVVLLRLL